MLAMRPGTSRGGPPSNHTLSVVEQFCIPGTNYRKVMTGDSRQEKVSVRYDPIQRMQNQNRETVCLDPVERMRLLIRSAKSPNITATVSFSRYQRCLHEVYTMAKGYIEEENLEKGLVMFLRFVTMVREDLPTHADYPMCGPQDKEKLDTMLVYAQQQVDESQRKLEVAYRADAEKMRRELERREREALANAAVYVEKLKEETARAANEAHSLHDQFVEINKKEPDENVPIEEREPAMVALLSQPSRLAPAPSSASSAQPAATAAAASKTTSVTSTAPTRSGQAMAPLAAPNQSNVFAQPSLPGPSKQAEQAQAHAASASAAASAAAATATLNPYSMFSHVQSVLPRDLGMNHNERTLMMHQALLSLQAAQSPLRIVQPVATVPVHVHVPVAPIVSMPTTAATHTQQQPAQQAVAPESKNHLTVMAVPQDLVDTFQNAARQANHEGREFVGILAGTVMRADPSLLSVSHIIIPTQTATATSFSIIGQKEVFEVQNVLGLLTLGWIKMKVGGGSPGLTIPDMQYQVLYQSVMTPAVAVICSDMSSAIVQLTPTGMCMAGGCQGPPHKHDKNHELYRVAQHIIYSDNIHTQIIDMRLLEQQAAQLTGQSMAPHSRRSM